MHIRARRAALSGLLSALAVVFLMMGSLIPAALYYTKGKWPKLLVLGGLLVLLALYANLTVQWYALLVLPLLALYSGKRGKYKLKYLFYIYYPVHLAVIWAIARWL